jgi:hypothetical protein
MLDEILVSVEFLRPRQDSRFSDSRAELLPRHQRDDRVVGVLLVVMGGNQRSADAVGAIPRQTTEGQRFGADSQNHAISTTPRQTFGAKLRDQSRVLLLSAH